MDAIITRLALRRLAEMLWSSLLDSTTPTAVPGNQCSWRIVQLVTANEFNVGYNGLAHGLNIEWQMCGSIEGSGPVSSYMKYVSTKL